MDIVRGDAGRCWQMANNRRNSMTQTATTTVVVVVVHLTLRHTFAADDNNKMMMMWCWWTIPTLKFTLTAFLDTQGLLKLLWMVYSEGKLQTCLKLRNIGLIVLISTLSCLMFDNKIVLVLKNIMVCSKQTIGDHNI